MTHERLIPALALSAVLVAGFGAIRPTSPDPEDELRTEEDVFYVTKTHGENRCDIIVLGDSRALRGIAPSVIEEVLPGRRVFNFAYNSGSLNPEMYREAEKRLDPAGEDPDAVLLAVTPLSLLAWKAANQQFAELRATPPDEVWLKMRWPRVVKYFQPMKPSALLGALFRKDRRPRTEQVFHEDGWIESDRTPQNPQEALELYAVRLKDRPVDPGLVDELVRQTREWESRGIRVFAFRPPTTDEVVALENRLTGFDEDALARRVEEAGGTWIRFGNDGYRTYDGSHLRRDSARAFSHELAVRVRAGLESPGHAGA